MIDLIFYNYETKQWERSTDTQTIKLNECLQELALYRGESWFYGNYGTDYEGLFNGEVDITAQVLAIIEKYQPFFRAITVESAREGETILFSVFFYLTNNTASFYDVGYTNNKSKNRGFDVKITKRS